MKNNEITILTDLLITAEQTTFRLTKA